MRHAWIFLLALGLLQMAGDVLRVPAVRAIAAATAASPAPKVFSAVRGLETYSTRFFIDWTDREGARHALLLTPDVYARLRGPYNRRNVFGAVLAYGPVLLSDPRTQPIFDSVARYALCGDAPILHELGLTEVDAREPVVVRLEPREGSDTGDLPLAFQPPCR